MTDCLIIGGGIIGLSSAYELLKHNLNITIIDNNDNFKGSASWAGAGIISPLYPWQYNDYINNLSIKSQALYPHICQQLLATTDIDPEYVNSGLLMLDQFNNKKAQKWLNKWQINYKLTNDGALFDVAQIRNNKMLKALKKYLILKGVKFIYEHVKNLDIKNNKVLGANNILAQSTLICAGAWTKNLTNLNIYPIKGQMITIFDKKNTINHIILKNNNYIVPRKDGVTLVGATLEDVKFDKNLTNAKQQLFEFLLSIFPEYNNAKITNHWCGFRPATKDVPIIDKHPLYNNLFVNSGHFRNGINTAPESAKIIASKIINN